jgi:hypothetical protein
MAGIELVSIAIDKTQQEMDGKNICQFYGLFVFLNTLDCPKQEKELTIFPNSVYRPVFTA